MKIINYLKLEKFAIDHAHARKSLATWRRIVKEAVWKNKKDVLHSFPTAKIIANNRARFEIKHNHYRLIAEIDYQDEILDVRFIGSHKDYDKIDVQTI
jgi:mRNA interferase HigB